MTEILDRNFLGDEKHPILSQRAFVIGTIHVTEVIVEWPTPFSAFSRQKNLKMIWCKDGKFSDNLEPVVHKDFWSDNSQWERDTRESIERTFRNHYRNLGA